MSFGAVSHRPFKLPASILENYATAAWRHTGKTRKGGYGSQERAHELTDIGIDSGRIAAIKPHLAAEELETFRARAFALLCIAGPARLPQISLAPGTIQNCPLGLLSSRRAALTAVSLIGLLTLSGLPIGPEVDASAARRPSRSTLRGRLTTVVPLDPEAHAQALYEGTHGPDRDGLWLYMGAGPFPDSAAFRAYLDNLAASDDPLSFTILDNARGRAVGHASFMRMVPEHRVIEVGNIFYAASLARTAGATEAMYLMARTVFDDLNYRRYEWKCNALNEPSRRAALRLGFSFEGTFRQHMIQKDRNRDTAWFAMLDHEWPARKARFEMWLRSDNFEASGRQRVPLSSLT